MFDKKLKDTPKHLADYAQDFLEGNFMMTDKKHVLTLHLSRRIDKCFDLYLNCHLYVSIAPAKGNDYSARIKMSHHLSTLACDVDRLEWLTLTCSDMGCRLGFMGMDIENIAASEREKLKEYLSNMRVLNCTQS